MAKPQGNRYVSLGGYVVLSNVGTSYDAVAVSKGLGLAVIDFSQVNGLELRVYCNKVGTGTQSWQLWNVTDAAEVAVVSDTGSTGEKTLTVTVTSGLPTGEKCIRLRCKSTVAGDDPVYYGACVKCW